MLIKKIHTIRLHCALYTLQFRVSDKSISFALSIYPCKKMLQLARAANSLMDLIKITTATVHHAF